MDTTENEITNGRIRRIDARMAELHAEYLSIMRGHVVPTGRAMVIRRKMDALCENREKAVKEAVKAEAERKREEILSLGENLPQDETTRDRIFHMMLKLPLAADFLYALCCDLASELRKHGMTELTLTERTGRIKKEASELAFTLNEFEPLRKMLEEDDTLIDALDKKLTSFLGRNLNIVRDSETERRRIGRKTDRKKKEGGNG